MENFNSLYTKSKIYFPQKLSKQFEDIDQKMFGGYGSFSHGSFDNGQNANLWLESIQNIVCLIRIDAAQIASEIRRELGESD